MKVFVNTVLGLISVFHNITECTAFLVQVFKCLKCWSDGNGHSFIWTVTKSGIP